MLVEVRVLLQKKLSDAVSKGNAGIGKAFRLFKNASREELAAHYAGIYTSKEKHTAWLRYRVFRDGEMTRHDGMRRAPTRILWVK